MSSNTPVLKRALSLRGLILFGLIYMVPLTIFTTYGLVTLETGGRLAPAYAITLFAMLFTALSYGVMVRAFPVAGSAFTFTRETFGPNPGFLVGWALLLDYLFLPMINFLVIGLYLGAEFPSVPQWVFVLVPLLLVMALNIIGIESIARANVLIVAAQALFVLVFVVLAVRHVGTLTGADWMGPLTGSAAYATAIADPSIGLAPLLAGAAILCLSFLGFDAVSTMSEETPHPERDIPRAILGVTVGAGVLFCALAYLGNLSMPEPRCLPALQPDCDFGDTAAIDLVMRLGGDFLRIFFLSAFITGAFGSALTSQAAVSRILYTMGREGALPRRFFGKLSPRFQTPTHTIVLVSLISALALWIDLALLASVISFGALAAFSGVNASVIKHHLIDRQQRSTSDLFRYGVLPAAGLCLTGWLWTNLSTEGMTLGLTWVGMGLIYLAVLTRGFRSQPPMIETRHIA